VKLNKTENPKMITKYLISGIATLLILGSCVREKQCEVASEKYSFQITNKVLMNAVDSFILKQYSPK
jgi:uncharacterized lipoprotein YajG